MKPFIFAVSIPAWLAVLSNAYGQATGDAARAVCSAFPKHVSKATGTKGKAAVSPKLGDSIFWKPGQTLRIGFLDGKEESRKNVERIASEWTRYANLTFHFVSLGELKKISDELNRIRFKGLALAPGVQRFKSVKGPDKFSYPEPVRAKAIELERKLELADADILITFQDTGYYSALGTNAKQTIAERKHSMRLGGLGNIPGNTPMFKAVVLHEFGHAIGLHHEHLSPDAKFSWNKPVVYQHYKTHNGWDQKMVDSQVLQALDPGSTNFTKFDPQSIMLYAFPPEFTVDRRSTSWNSELSMNDKTYAAQIYPKVK